MDDIRKDPKSFLNAMSVIAKLELEFGNHFPKPEMASSDAIRQYQEIVKAKITYLDQIQDKEINDEAITELASMQMRINETASEAFGKE